MYDFDFNTPINLMGFFEENYEALQNAALLLGGQPGVRCVQALMDELRQQPTVTMRIARNLTRLLKLLTLENVHVEGSIEAANFAQIDPASPNVEDICLLADGLETHMRDLLIQR